MSNGIETAPATGDKRRKRAHRDGHCTTNYPTQNGSGSLRLRTPSLPVS